MKRVMFFLCVIGLFVLPALGQAKWEPMTLTTEQEISYSEGWSLDGCKIFLLKEGNGIFIVTEQGMVNGHVTRMHTRPDGSYKATEATIQLIRITGDDGKVDMHLEWESQETLGYYRSLHWNGPDLFYLLYISDAQSLPSHIKKQFHRLYGIEP